MMLRLIAVAILSAVPAMATAGTTICRPTFDGMLEFECREKEGVKIAASFCEVMNRQGGPVRWSRRDTEETKNRADLINAAGKRLCAWR